MKASPLKSNLASLMLAASKPQTPKFSNLNLKRLIMTTPFFLSAFFFLTTTASFSQDAPQSCEKEIKAFDNARGEVVAEARVAKEYYMNSEAPDVGDDYDERRANLRTKVRKLLADYEQKRKQEYSLTRCSFYKEKSATSRSGRVRKNEAIVISDNYEFIPETIEHTTNGDWKKGPVYNGKTLSWTTGTESGRAWTFVRIKTKYTENFIIQSLNQEIANIKLELNNLGIPAE